MLSLLSRHARVRGPHLPLALRAVTIRRATLLPSCSSVLRPQCWHVTASHLLAAGGVAATLISLLTDGTAQCKAQEPVVVQADSLFDANEYAALTTLLRTVVSNSPDNAELQWRLGRACKKLSDAEQPKSKAKEALVREGLACAERALQLDDSCGAAHKWYAILLSGTGEFGGTSDTIKNSFVVRSHFERACDLMPTDATSRHLLGLWCFEVAKLSWVERKAAALLFATPPTATFEQAIEHFEAAERMDPGFYPKNLLMLAKSCAKLGRGEEAAAWKARCLAATAKTPEDEETLKEAAKLAM